MHNRASKSSKRPGLLKKEIASIHVLKRTKIMSDMVFEGKKLNYYTIII